MKKKNFNRASQSESGQVIILLALGLVTLLAFVALAIDGGMYYSNRRDAQGGVDAAAMSAAYAACMGEDPIQAAIFAASLNGYTNDGINTVTVNAPPVNGDYAGVDGYYEVVITTESETTFLKVLNPEPLKTTVRTVTYCENNSTNPAIIGSALVSLNPNDPSSFFMNGNGNVVVKDGGIFVNSDDTKAMVITGNGEVKSDSISVVGGFNLKNPAKVIPTPVSGVNQITNPMAGLTPPPKPAGPCTTVSITGGSNVTLNPGLYCNMKIAGNGNVFLNPGIYWIESGGLQYTGNGDVSANGVMFYLGPGAGGVNIAGNGDFNITPPTSGDYAGLSFFQDPGNTNTFKIVGNGDTNGMFGTFYAPTAQFQISGNGDFNLNAQLIGDTIRCTGNGDINIIHNPDYNYQATFPILVSLME